MKQLSKRVSAALPAVLMGLSLLPQTVLALDPDQRQAERREGYDVATVHYTDAKGDEQAIPFTETGSGYVYTLPQGVTEDKATVEYFSTTRWDGAVDISWYNDTDREFTLTNPAQLAGLAKLVKENVTLRGQDHQAWARTSICCGMRRPASPGGTASASPPAPPPCSRVPLTAAATPSTRCWPVPAAPAQACS